MKKILSILTILFTFSFTSHSYSKTEIHWWYGNSGFLGDVIIEIANRFNASQNDYTVIPTGKGSYEDNMAATIAAFRAGDQPHYSQVYDAGAAIMVAQVKNGVVIGFEEMAEKYGIKVDADNYIPGIKNFYADSDGKMIGVPFNSSTCLMYANMDILKKVGIESVPKTYEDLEILPGVGHKTASVVMSQGFGFPAFPVDTHIHRLAQRWGLTNGKNVVQTENDLKEIFPKKYWNKLHLQIIWYGREFCKARDCYGITCKICKSCYPNRKKPIKTKKA